MNINEWTGSEYSQEVVEQATYWISVLDSNMNDSEVQDISAGVSNLSDENKTKFFAWLSADVSHQYVYADCSELWAKTQCIQSFHEALTQSKILHFPIKNHTAKDIQMPSLMSERTINNCVAPGWAYHVVIGLVVLGMALPSIL